MINFFLQINWSGPFSKNGNSYIYSQHTSVAFKSIFSKVTGPIIFFNEKRALLKLEILTLYLCFSLLSIVLLTSGIAKACILLEHIFVRWLLVYRPLILISNCIHFLCLWSLWTVGMAFSLLQNQHDIMLLFSLTDCVTKSNIIQRKMTLIVIFH